MPKVSMDSSLVVLAAAVPGASEEVCACDGALGVPAAGATTFVETSSVWTADPELICPLAAISAAGAGDSSLGFI